MPARAPNRKRAESGTATDLRQNSSCVAPLGYLYFALFSKENTALMRRPKGIKTRKSVAKRFKITARGKVLRMHAGKRHLLATKSPKRRRKLGTAVVIDPTDARRVLENLPFTR
jgi:large subunit ribosomal protein L35